MLFLIVTSFQLYFCIQIFGSFLLYLEKIFGLSAESDIADSWISTCFFAIFKISIYSGLMPGDIFVK